NGDVKRDCSTKRTRWGVSGNRGGENRLLRTFLYIFKKGNPGGSALFPSPEFTTGFSPFADIQFPRHKRGPIMKKAFVSAVFLALVSLLAALESKSQSSSIPIQDFFKSYFEEALQDDPEYATTVGRHDYDDRWSDLSRAGRERRLSHMRSRLAELAKYRL